MPPWPVWTNSHCSHFQCRKLVPGCNLALREVGVHSETTVISHPRWAARCTKFSSLSGFYFSILTDPIRTWPGIASTTRIWGPKCCSSAWRVAMRCSRWNWFQSILLRARWGRILFATALFQTGSGTATITRSLPSMSVTAMAVTSPDSGSTNRPTRQNDQRIRLLEQEQNLVALSATSGPITSLWGSGSERVSPSTDGWLIESYEATVGQFPRWQATPRACHDETPMKTDSANLWSCHGLTQLDVHRPRQQSFEQLIHASSRNKAQLDQLHQPLQHLPLVQEQNLRHQPNWQPWSNDLRWQTQNR